MDGSKLKLLKNRLVLSALGVLAFMLLAPGLWSRLSSNSSQTPEEVAVVAELAGSEAEAQEATAEPTAEPTAEATAEPTAEPDSTPPTINVVAPADGTTTNDATPEISAALTEDGSGVDEATIVLTLDGATVAHIYAPTAKTVSYTPDTNLADGSYTLTLAVSDVAGNAATPASATFTVDTVAPTVTASPAGGLYNSPQVVSLTTSDPGTIYYTTDETDPTTSSTQYTDPITVSQPTVLKFIAVDAVGNQSPVSTEEYTIDTVPPVGTVSINKGAVFTRSTTVSVAVAATDDISGLSQVRIANSPEMIGSELANGTTYPYSGYKSWNLVDTDNGTHTVYVQWSDKAGNWSVVEHDTIELDTAAPTVNTPVRTFVVPSAVTGNAVPVRINWTAADEISGLARYEVQQSLNGGKWSWVARSTTADTLIRYLVPGKHYQFRIRAYDRAGNISTWTNGTGMKVASYQESHASITYSGKWMPVKLRDAYSQSVRYTTVADARASIAFMGSNVAWVSRKTPDSGQAEVYVDGRYIATLDLYSATTQPRQIVFTIGDLGLPAGHTLEVRTLGTKNLSSEGTRVYVDAFVVLP